ncbi:hypothetical protein [Micromonospora sp. LH3U1]|uniref:hypothetical protein n=1 Tax=Micromonospora sp. LH3U1 TaxID=3018339 RepID=UPI00234BC708|nr:hypothetical protein [Micromonospora sp. LH3U1]WCN78928.1 hypothetical protein PCA76_18035 [Micromonospora sp. LH3U1]
MSRPSGERNRRPLVALETGGVATVLSYNVPEPTAYPGRNLIDLPFDASYFTSAVAQAPDRLTLEGRPIGEVIGIVRDSLTTGYLDPRVFPLAQGGGHALSGAARVRRAGARIRTVGSAKQWNPQTGEVDEPELPVEDEPGGSGGGHNGSGGGAPADDSVFEIAGHIQAGMSVAVYTDLWGNQVPVFVPQPAAPEPRLMLVEEYRLSTYLGAYGAGRVVQTMTLLPGEKTTISVKTYTRSSSTQAEASSILDSFSEESATGFETAVQAEQSDQSDYAKSFEYNAEAEASASWGFGSVKVSGGVAGSTNSSRQEFAKNVSSATETHAASASSKRDVQVNSSSEVSTEVGEETAITREISNINLSAPLNYVFRQMNQEFVTFLHLVDVRVAFFNNFAESKRERTLPELDALLDEVMVDNRAKKTEVREEVLHSLNTLFDWRGEPVTDALKRSRYPERDGSVTTVWQFNRERVSEYSDPVTGTSFTVPGVIMSVQKNVMRTEGIIVEAVLGQALALDPYNSDLQDEALRERRIANEAAELANSRERLAQHVVGTGSTEQADRYATVFAPTDPPSPATPAPTS